MITSESPEFGYTNEVAGWSAQSETSVRIRTATRTLLECGRGFDPQRLDVSIRLYCDNGARSYNTRMAMLKRICLHVCAAGSLNPRAQPPIGDSYFLPIQDVLDIVMDSIRTVKSAF